MGLELHVTFLSSFRKVLSPVARPARNKLGVIGRGRRKARFLRDGIEGIAMELRSTTNQHAAILREFGAHVGARCSIYTPLHIVNADGDFSKLTIGDRVHLGADTLIDLAEAVTIESEATISMRCTLVTHIDVGPGPLSQRRPRKTGPVRIGTGAYLGAGVTVLHGVTVGALATLGAHALVDRDVAPGATVVSPRAATLPRDA
jgi:acetyltransferase-like isoleucine patch superfamily enzyme